MTVNGRISSKKYSLNKKLASFKLQHYTSNFKYFVFNSPKDK